MFAFAAAVAAAATAAKSRLAAGVCEGVGVTLIVDVSDGVVDTVGVREELRLGVVVGVTETVGVLDAVAPVDKEGVGVGVTVDDGVAVRLGVGATAIRNDTDEAV